MPTQTFKVNGTDVSVDVEDDVRLLWVLRDLLDVTGPKYGCGLAVCQACTSLINGEIFNPCIVSVGDLKATDEIVTIEGLADTVEGDLHPVQEVWLEEDVAQCGFCQPGQIFAAIELIERVQAENRSITEADLDGIANICRCGTYPRIRTATVIAEQRMAQVATVPTADPTGQVDAGGDPSVLPATGAEALLGAATIAAGTAVAIRRAGEAAKPEPLIEDADRLGTR